MLLNPGTELSQYEVIEPIAAGGMGEMYRAHDTKLGRDIAIKVLPLHGLEEHDTSFSGSRRPSMSPR